MGSLYGLFEEDWQNRADFPIALDVQYCLMKIQSKLATSSEVHPMLSRVYMVINRRNVAIIKAIEKRRNERLGDRYWLLHEFEIEVLIQIFHYSIADIFAYLDAVIEMYGAEYILNEMPGVGYRDYVFYVWGDFFETWIPIEIHPLLDSFVEKLIERYSAYFGGL
jgi:hypothetical protein